MRASLWLCLLIVAVGSSVVGSAGAAEVYKWRDQSGRLHFSDKPPEGTVQVDKIVIDADAPIPEFSETKERTAAMKKAANAIAGDSQARSNQRNEKQKKANDLAAKCAQARNAYEDLLRATGVTVKDENGDVRLLGDEHLVAARQKLQDMIRQSCD